MNKTLLKIITLGTLASTSVQAASISGSTNFQVVVPEILVLYHWDEAQITLTNTVSTPVNDSDANEISDPTLRNLNQALGSTSTYTITNDVNTTNGSTPTTLAIVDVVLQNSWAVRSISSGNVDLEVSEQAGGYTLKNTADNTNTIAITDVKLRQGTITPAATISLAPGWTPKLGNIEFRLNLANLENSGTYTSNGTTTSADASDTFLLTLEGN